MPRKVTSSGESTQGRKTSMKRAMGAGGAGKQRSEIPDGGKWASGRKAVEHGEGPALTRQAQPGRGPKTRSTVRTGKANHPNHG
jgi:hypothetical protein